MAAISVSHPTGPYSFAAGGGTAAAQGEITGIDWANLIVVVISGLTSETVSATGKVPGSAVYTSKIMPIDLATGVAASSKDLGNGSYLFKDWALDSIKFTKTSTSETAVITVGIKGIRN